MRGCLDYRTNRRAVLQASLASILGFSMRDLIARAGETQTATAEHVIFFWNGGGMSHIDTFDPKPGRETGGEFDAIDTSVPGVKISQIFPELAKVMHHCALIRSIAGTNGDHGRGTYQLQTSYNQSANLIHPGFGSVVTHEKKPIGDLPAYVTISGRAPKASYLGQKCEAYFIGAPGEKDPYLSFPEGIASARGNQRLEVLEKFNGRFAEKSSNKELKATQTSIDEALTLMRSPALAAFELDKVPTSQLNRYGDTPFGRGCLVAKQLVETGVRFVQVNRGGFDTHMNNFPAMEAHGEIMDPALASLIADLADSGMLKKTLVVMLSEFGRTPKINKDSGRDHWPNVFTCFCAGGGIKGGTVIGTSDADGYEPDKDPVKVPNLHASFCYALGIDPDKKVMTPLQRPFKLVEDGTPIKELFA
jgi:hypothetical protein